MGFRKIIVAALGALDFVGAVACPMGAFGPGVVCLAGSARVTLGQDAPNIVVILADDLGWRDVGFMGSTFHETPHLDRLASESLVFTDAYSAGPNCSPSRASLLTGAWTPRHRLHSPVRSDKAPRALMRLKTEVIPTTLDPSWTTLAEALDTHVSAAMGKWHMGDDPERGPIAQGFDVNIGGGRWGHPPAGYFAPFDVPNLDAPDGAYLTDRLTDEAVTFIESNRDEPFFLYLSHYAVHTPIQAPDALVDRFRGRPGAGGQRNPTYAAMIASLDESVGRVLEALDRLDLADETVVIFTSDNGGYSGATSMAPLRGWKGQLYEGGIRVPFTVRWPGRIAPGRTDAIITGVDLMPTLCSIAGVESPASDGVDLVPVLEGGALERNTIYWHFPCYLRGKTGERDPWRKGLRQTPAGAIRMGDHKLIEFFEDGHVELYDLVRDPSESTDLASRDPERAASMRRMLEAWRRDLGAFVPTERLDDPD